MAQSRLAWLEKSTQTRTLTSIRTNLTIKHSVAESLIEMNIALVLFVSLSLMCGARVCDPEPEYQKCLNKLDECIRKGPRDSAGRYKEACLCLEAQAFRSCVKTAFSCYYGTHVYRVFPGIS
jgi:hypothetical protein